MRLVLLAVIAVCMMTQPALAAGVVSDFEDGSLQGWVATGDVAGVTNPGIGGNPRGFVRMVDQAVGGVCWMVAPSRYLGNWHGKASLSVDLTQVSYSGSHYMNVQFVISGPGGTYTRDFGERPPLGAWRTYATPLAESLWTCNSGNWDALLDNVTQLKITMEFITGDETNGLDNVVLTDSYATTTIGKAKLLADGADVVVDGVVTVVTDQFMYIQSEDRAAGIRVKNSFAQEPGDRVRIGGQMATERGERYLNYGLVYSSTPGGRPNPLLVLNRELGGVGACVLDPVLGASITLKETGLLVRTFGRVASIGDDGSFSIIDGGPAGVRVVPGLDSVKPIPQSYVAVTGVSSSDGAESPQPVIVAGDDVQTLWLPYGQNLIRNAGAEEGQGGTGSVVRPMLGWTTTSNFTVLNYGSDIPVSEGVRIDGGRSCFSGGPNNALSEAYQSMDVSSLARDIDAGAVSAELSGYLAGWSTQADNMLVTATFYDASDVGLGSVKIGPQAGSQEKWVFHQQSGDVPVGCRRIEVRMKSTRLEGSGNSGYADRLSLILTKR